MKQLETTILLLLMLFSTNLFAQKTEKICGTYTYIVPENVSVEQAKKTAVERAKIEALANQYGTIVSQTNTTFIKTENEKSDFSFSSLGGTEVKGEWIEDTKEPEITSRLENGMLIITAKVCGKAREITSAGIDFSAKVLRNGTEERFESNDFKHNDDIFLWFRSPVDGYLAVYLLDDNQTVFCLLPYLNDASGKTHIKGGKEYVFFSEKHATPAEKPLVKEYVLTCEKLMEHNTLYIIFSPHEFTKANDSEGNEALPRELSFEDFQKWRTKNMQRDKDMKVEIKSLMIKK